MEKVSIVNSSEAIFSDFILKKIFKDYNSKSYYSGDNKKYWSIQKMDNNMIELYSCKIAGDVNGKGFEKKLYSELFYAKDIVALEKKFYFDIIPILRLIWFLIGLKIFGIIFQVITDALPDVIVLILGIIISLFAIMMLICYIIDVFKYKYEIVINRAHPKRLLVLCIDYDSAMDLELFIQEIIMGNKENL